MWSYAMMKHGNHALHVPRCHTAVSETGFSEFGSPATTLYGWILHQFRMAPGATFGHALVADGQPARAEGPVLLRTMSASSAFRAYSHTVGLARGGGVVRALRIALGVMILTTTSEIEEADNTKE